MIEDKDCVKNPLVEITYSDGEMIKCELLDMFDVEGNLYASCKNLESGDISFFVCTVVDKKINLIDIEDDSIFEKVEDRYNKLKGF